MPYENSLLGIVEWCIQMEITAFRMVSFAKELFDGQMSTYTLRPNSGSVARSRKDPNWNPDLGWHTNTTMVGLVDVTAGNTVEVWEAEAEKSIGIMKTS